MKESTFNLLIDLIIKLKVIKTRTTVFYENESQGSSKIRKSEICLKIMQPLHDIKMLLRKKR